ncbi:MAG TPA: hypothetical protein VMV15_06540 [Candidatus Binataceae bacterium]|nr:hypothetical protein [Candidatus Binataceae bacterium]
MHFSEAIQQARRPLEKYGLITAGAGLVLAVLSRTSGLEGLGVFMLLGGLIAAGVGSAGAWIDRQKSVM